MMSSWDVSTEVETRLQRVKGFTIKNVVNEKMFEDELKPCYIGIHMKALNEYLQIDTHEMGFHQSKRAF